MDPGNPYDTSNPGAGKPNTGSGPFSDEQMKVLQSLLGAQAAAGGQLLSESQVLALKAESEKYHAAQQEVAKSLGDALATLWNTQLDLAISLGRADRIEQAMAGVPHARWYDNCNCGGGGGTTCW